MYFKDGKLPKDFTIPKNYGGNAFTDSGGLKLKDELKPKEKQIYSKPQKPSLSPSYLSSISSRAVKKSEPAEAEKEKSSLPSGANLPKSILESMGCNDDLIILGLILLFMEEGTGKDILPILFMLLLFKKQP